MVVEAIARLARVLRDFSPSTKPMTDAEIVESMTRGRRVVIYSHAHDTYSAGQPAFVTDVELWDDGQNMAHLLHKEDKAWHMTPRAIREAEGWIRLPETDNDVVELAGPGGMIVRREMTEEQRRRSGW